MALSSSKQLRTHGQEHTNNNKIKKEAILLAFSKQQVGVVCKAQASKLQMLKTKFSGLGSNIIYKAQISLFTRVTWRQRLLTVVAAAGAAGSCFSLTNPPLLVFVWVVCCCCCLVHAPPPNTTFLCLVFGVKMQTGH